METINYINSDNTNIVELSLQNGKWVVTSYGVDKTSSKLTVLNSKSTRVASRAQDYLDAFRLAYSCHYELEEIRIHDLAA